MLIDPFIFVFIQVHKVLAKMPEETEKTEKTVLQKFLAINSKPTAETFPELPDALVWREFLIFR